MTKQKGEEMSVERRRRSIMKLSTKTRQAESVEVTKMTEKAWCKVFVSFSNRKSCMEELKGIVAKMWKRSRGTERRGEIGYCDMLRKRHRNRVRKRAIKLSKLSKSKKKEKRCKQIYKGNK